jgi:isoquinoline 1-oxidoreductase beta subunit
MGEDGKVRVAKLAAVADVGRVMNPDIARQQIEGGLLYGMGIATGAPVTLRDGTPGPARLGELRLPLLADMPEITVELVRSSDAPGGVGELAVPPVGPALANALFAASGQRYRSLPLGAGAI